MFIDNHLLPEVNRKRARETREKPCSMDEPAESPRLGKAEAGRIWSDGAPVVYDAAKFEVRDTLVRMVEHPQPSDLP